MRIWRGGRLAAAALGTLVAVNCGGASQSNRCITGESEACACSDGRMGAQICNSDGTFDTCVCSGPSAVGGGHGPDVPQSGGEPPETVGGARTNLGGAAGVLAGGSGDGGADTEPEGGTSSARPIGGAPEGGAPQGGDSGAAGAPGQATAGTGDGGSSGDCPLVEEEWCDGVDNDCDGAIDNHEVCPDDSVQNTDPLTQGVYLLGTTVEGLCGKDALQQFWPTQPATYSSGFDCYADTYIFRPSDGIVFYTATFKGLYQDKPGGTDTLIDTPPCGASVDSYYGNPTFGFDASDTLYYQCTDTVRRGNGALIAQSIEKLVGVLADGRVLITSPSLSGVGSDFAVIDSKGKELNRLEAGDISGEVTPNPGATTVSGNRGYVAFNRDFGQSKHEVIAYRLTEKNEWQRIRRVAVPAAAWTLVVSDGTVFVRIYDSDLGDVITAYLPDNSMRIVWREIDQTVVRAHIGDELLLGPLLK